MAFGEMSNRENLQNITNTKIEVDGVSYNFGDLILNENIYDFPQYSHKIRTLAVKLAEVTDKYLDELDEELTKKETEHKKIIKEEIETVFSKFNDEKNEKIKDIEHATKSLNDEIQTLKTLKNQLEKLKSNIEDLNIQDEIKKEVDEKIKNIKHSKKNKQWHKFENNVVENWDEVMVCFDSYIWKFDYYTLKAINKLDTPIRVYEDDDGKGYAIHGTFRALENGFRYDRSQNKGVNVEIYYTIREELD
ncbi:hypothetical protein [Caviibacter abscessus]|uniref:hypothetical protein n=1 Tax=Caviibacter abscessus TaxID=1766719 RepID=UPI0008391EBD|nr:hypothetical protein [Caviibacter abscessus]